MTEQENEKIIIEFEEARAKYFEAIKKGIEFNIHSIFDKVAGGCNIGEATCHGGTFLPGIDRVINPGPDRVKEIKNRKL